jgi:NAD(P)-dependent dehydrogenase (short-subunit alcohol dehydrogenase family)
MTSLHKNKVALVTGGGSGIGLAAALAFSVEGATVVIADIDLNAANSAAELARANGSEASAIACDMRDRSQITSMIDKAASIHGRLDFAFNNVGVGGPIQPLGEYSDADWDSVIATNLTSVFLCMRAEIGVMLQQGSGVIVNCASVSGMAGMPGMPAYSASKHGILGLTKTAALDYAPHGIRINAVCPGTIHTPAVDRFLKDEPDAARPIIDAMIAAQPIGRLGTPEEVAAAVVWLCHPTASFMVGHGLVVDGGYLAQ